MTYTDYLRLEGLCSIALGVVLAAVAVPGLSGTDVWALLFVPATVGFLAVVGVRAGAPAGSPGAWLTTRPLRTAAAGRAALPAGPLRRRLLIETAVWIVGGAALVLIADSSHGLFLGTGLASAAFGAIQAFPARAHVQAAEAAGTGRLLVAERPGIGTPRLGVAAS